MNEYLICPNANECDVYKKDQTAKESEQMVTNHNTDKPLGRRYSCLSLQNIAGNGEGCTLIQILNNQDKILAKCNH